MPHLATVEHVMALEEKLASDKEGVVLLPGVMDLLNKIDPDDWTICTAGTFPMAIGRLNQFGIKAPPKMVTGDKVKSTLKKERERDLHLSSSLVLVNPILKVICWQPIISTEIPRHVLYLKMHLLVFRLLLLPA